MSSHTAQLTLLTIICFQAFSAHVARFFRLRTSVDTPDGKRGRTRDADDMLSIFDMEWLVVATDEIHEQRGSTNRVFVGMCQLRQYGKVAFSIGMSATPILNNPRVRLCICRFVCV